MSMSGKYGTRHKVVAAMLVITIVVSFFSAYSGGLVDIFTAKSATTGTTYHYINTTLYDYYSDSQFTNGSYNGNAPTDGNSIGADGNTFKHFNTALVEGSYALNGNSESYYPLYCGLIYPGSNLKTTGGINLKVDDPYNFHIAANSEQSSYYSAAAQGLVNDFLVGGKVTQGTSNRTLPYFDSSFLSTYGVGTTYSGLKFPFEYISSSKTVNGRDYNGYYVYDSTQAVSSKVVRYNGTNFVHTNNTYYQSSANNAGNWAGFFPLNEENTTSFSGGTNFGFGMEMSFNFTMTADGKYDCDGDGDRDDIIFEFRGDDDLWVFIDGRLILDVGGAHGAVHGEIDFGTKTVSVDHTKTDAAFETTDGSYGTVNGETTSTFSQLGFDYLFEDPTASHELKIFYMERGQLDSNLFISFNFPLTDVITVENQVDASNVNPALRTTALKAANEHSMEYVMYNNGAATNASPDAGDSISVTEERNREGNPPEPKTGEVDSASAYNVYFKFSTNSINNQIGTDLKSTLSSLMTTKTAKGLQWISLPKVSAYTYTDSDDVEYQPVWTKDEAGTGLKYSSSYRTSRETTFYLSWEKVPWDYTDSEILNANYKPTVIFLETGGSTNWDLSTGIKLSAPLVSDVGDSTDSNYPFAYIANSSSTHQYIALLTKANCNDTNAYLRFTNWSDENSWSRYPVQNDSGTDVSGDSLKLTAGYIYYVEVKGGNGESGSRRYQSKKAFTDSTIQTAAAIDNSNKFFGTGSVDTDEATFLTKYVALYNALESAREQLDSLNKKDDDLYNAYMTARTFYLNINYTTNTRDTLIGTGANSIQAQIEALSAAGATVVSSYSLRAMALAPEEDESDTTDTTEQTVTTNSDETDTTKQGDASEQTTTSENDTNASNITDADTSATLASGVAANKGILPTLLQLGTGISAQSTSNGAFEGSSSGYVKVANTNYTLYDPNFAKTADSADDDTDTFVIRQTTSDGTFRLRYNQKAIFTAQFTSESRFLLAQQSDYMQYPGTISIETSGTAKTDLNKMYSTTWKVTDLNNVSVGNSTGYVAYTDGNGNDTLQNKDTETGTNNTILLKNKTSDDNTKNGARINVVYTNKILVGDIRITKEITESLKTSSADEKFYFYVELKDVFGGYTGDSDEYTPYTGGFTVDESEGAFETLTVGDKTYSCIALTDAQTAVITGIPVNTEYKITEIIPEGKNYHVKSIEESVIVADGDTNTKLSTSTKTGADAKTALVSGTLVAARDSTNDADSNSLIGAYQAYTSVTGNSSTHYTYTNTNNEAYIKITKTINELYYGANDNPAGLLDMDPKPLIGAISNSTEEDPNGYERATEADQTFIFKITEYSDEYHTVTKTFYETISFGINEGTAKSKYIRVDPNKYYEIEETTDWAWKYNFSTKSVDPTSGNDASDMTNTKIKIHTFSETMDGETQYLPIAKANYTNNKNTDKKDIEGDTAQIINIIRKAS